MPAEAQKHAVSDHWSSEHGWRRRELVVGMRAEQSGCKASRINSTVLLVVAHTDKRAKAGSVRVAVGYAKRSVSMSWACHQGLAASSC